jgi:serine protease
MAMEWCADNGARVINLSISGFDPSSAERILIRRLVKKENIVVVAAAGNDGSASLAYPASYSEVISVAAVDRRLKRAYFSQHNKQVDIAAPGVNVLSTVPSQYIIQDSKGNTHECHKFQDSFKPPVPLSVAIAGCGKMGTTCIHGKNSFCLIEGGPVSLLKQAVNAARSGCRAAIMYNDRSLPLDEIPGGYFRSPNNRVLVPVLGVSRRSALSLLRGTAATLYRDNSTKGYYAKQDGTSMAAAHVTGAVAKIWAARPRCTNKQVREAIQNTALDLGAPGRDDKTGYGLVQTWAAYKVSRSYLICLLFDLFSHINVCPFSSTY